MMKNEMFLSADQIKELTNRVQHSAQSRVLSSMGIEHIARPDGSIAVLREHVEQTMSGGHEKKKAKRVEPNWSALRAA
jgi:limonene-1,2-epoxide hydrolase